MLDPSTRLLIMFHHLKMSSLMSLLSSWDFESPFFLAGLSLAISLVISKFVFFKESDKNKPYFSS